jgi:hypothetical protein
MTEESKSAAPEQPDHAATHMDAHAQLSDDDHGHAEDALGPIDWQAWAYALIGVAAGVLVVVAFWVAVARPFA